MLEITTEDIKIVISALFKNKLLIILLTIAGVSSGLMYSSGLKTEYTYGASAAVSAVYSVGQGPISSSAVLTNYTEILTSDRVCEYAAALIADGDVTAERIRSMIHVSSGSNSYVLKIGARGVNPELSVKVANAVADGFVYQTAVITGNNAVQVLDYAKSADIVSNNRSYAVMLLFPAAAFIFACLLAVIAEIAPGRLRSVGQCVDDESELLTVIPKVNRRRP